MAFEVDKNIPLPPQSTRGGNTRYPFDRMVVGDSFLIENMETARKVSQAAVAYARNRDMKFSVRKIKNGFRCWRIK